jgi:hypothetical protein
VKFRIEHGAVWFHFPGGILVHIRQADNDKADVVVIGAGKPISLILSAEELIELLVKESQNAR